MIASKPMFFNEIVGLRIYLALWVAVGHGLQLAGFLDKSNAILKVLLNGHSAVMVFIIISGFVITNLLLVKRETYPRYIVRRFFRLYPAYVLCLTAGYFIWDDWAWIVRNVPWSSPSWARYSAQIVEIRGEMDRNFWPHFLLHGIMMHGAVPDAVLNRAAMTFVPAAWSISLEWQFYLVAPLVIAAFRKPWQTLLVVAIALGAFAAYELGLLGHYDIQSSLAASTPWFIVGIVSRLGFERLSRLSLSPLLVGVPIAMAVMLVIPEPLPIALWAVFFSYMLWQRNAPVTGAIFRFFTTTRPFQLLGEASYSLYLVHRPVQIALASAIMTGFAVTQWSMVVIQFAAILIAIPLSILMYFTVERAGIKLGQRLAQRLPGPSTPAEPSPPPVPLAS
ncbi:acyltransferase family protein [Novosphingobium album (ex Liu et al. 2023)]|uniref:Acyltransferase n=1 Tax=Novosphingobium album (ex Liu et al. 2023) TaxID=3031130 RepID=A0ABT5WK88_9SPHN|nr:acyltransferase [Novosphingobium album (ex Liu et al. 2023)]MDE8650462.1 acyltransferase [Novosphingobium album (ex Liu et al. 2023)]